MSRTIPTHVYNIDPDKHFHGYKKIRVCASDLKLGFLFYKLRIGFLVSGTKYDTYQRLSEFLVRDDLLMMNCVLKFLNPIKSTKNILTIKELFFSRLLVLSYLLLNLAINRFRDGLTPNSSDII